MPVTCRLPVYYNATMALHKALLVMKLKYIGYEYAKELMTG